MALTVAELNTRLTADISNLQRGLDRAQKDVNSFTGSASKAVKGLAAGFAAKEIAQGIGSVITAASDLGETVNKANVIFGQSSQAIQSWSDTAATSMGLSKQSALEAAATFGNMFDQLGLGSDQVTSLSTQMVQLASDFGSFHNADISQILDAQAAAFRGEYDALQRFVPLISAATIETKALEMSGKKNKDTLTAQDKALAAVQLMLDGAGAAAGDFARTSDSAANQTKKMKSQIEDLKTELGEGLLPAFTSVVGFINDKGIPAFKELFGVGDRTGKGFFAKANDFISDIAGFGAGAIQQTLRGGANLTEVLGIGGKFGEVTGDLRDAADALDGFRDKMHSSQQEVVSAQNAQKGFEGATKAATSSVKGMGGAVKATAEELADLKDAQYAAKDASFALKDAQTDAADAQKELNDLLATGGVDADKVKSATEDLAQANARLVDANERVTDAQDDYNKALADASATHLKDVERATDDLRKAQEKLAEQTQDVADAEAKLAKLKAQKQARDQAIKNAQAQLAAADTVTERIIAQNALSKALGMEIVTDQELEAAQRDVAVQQDQVKGATQDVTQAQTDLNTVQSQSPAQSDAVTNAAKRLEDAQKAAKTATDGVTTAQNALTQAQAVSPGYAAEVERAQRAVERANWDVEKATWAAQKAQDAYNKALRETPGAVTTTVTRNEIVNTTVRLTTEMVQGNVAAVSGAGPVVPLQMRPTLVMHDGGMVPGPRGADVPAILQAGERVTSAADVRAGEDQQPIIVQLVADGKVIQEILLAHQRRSGSLGFN